MKKISWMNAKPVKQENHRRLDRITLRDSQTGLYHEVFFNEFLALEKKRLERSEDPVPLMLADLSSFTDVSERRKIAKSMVHMLSDVTRDTDIKGWHVDGLVIGIMFTEMGKAAASPSILRRVVNKCLRHLRSHLGVESYSRIQISWHSVQSGRILDVDNVSVG